MKLEKSNLDNISEYFIFLSKKNKKVITNKKLQKLLYYTQAWNLVINNEKAFDEKIEAWVHGPAVMSTYQRFRDFSFGNIDINIKKEDIDLKDSLKRTVESVWRVYGKHKADYLESLTHQEDPWIIARGDKLPHQNSNNQISLKSIKDYYSKKYGQ